MKNIGLMLILFVMFSFSTSENEKCSSDEECKVNLDTDIESLLWHDELFCTSNGKIGTDCDFQGNAVNLSDPLFFKRNIRAENASELYLKLDLNTVKSISLKDCNDVTIKLSSNKENTGLSKMESDFYALRSQIFNLSGFDRYGLTDSFVDFFFLGAIFPSFEMNYTMINHLLHSPNTDIDGSIDAQLHQNGIVTEHSFVGSIINRIEGLTSPAGRIMTFDFTRISEIWNSALYTKIKDSHIVAVHSYGLTFTQCEILIENTIIDHVYENGIIPFTKDHHHYNGIKLNEISNLTLINVTIHQCDIPCIKMDNFTTFHFSNLKINNLNIESTEDMLRMMKDKYPEYNIRDLTDSCKIISSRQQCDNRPLIIIKLHCYYVSSFDCNFKNSGQDKIKLSLPTSDGKYPWLSLKNRKNLNIIEGNVDYLYLYNITGTYSTNLSPAMRKPTHIEVDIKHCIMNYFKLNSNASVLIGESTFEYFFAAKVYNLTMSNVIFNIMEHLEFENNNPGALLEMDNITADVIESFILQTPAVMNNLKVKRLSRLQVNHTSNIPTIIRGLNVGYFPAKGLYVTSGKLVLDNLRYQNSEKGAIFLEKHSQLFLNIIETILDCNSGPLISAYHSSQVTFLSKVSADWIEACVESRSSNLELDSTEISELKKSIWNTNYVTNNMCYNYKNDLICRSNRKGSFYLIGHPSLIHQSTAIINLEDMESLTIGYHKFPFVNVNRCTLNGIINFPRFSRPYVLETRNATVNSISMESGQIFFIHSTVSKIYPVDGKNLRVSLIKSHLNILGGPLKELRLSTNSKVNIIKNVEVHYESAIMNCFINRIKSLKAPNVTLTITNSTINTIDHNGITDIKNMVLKNVFIKNILPDSIARIQFCSTLNVSFYDNSSRSIKFLRNTLYKTDTVKEMVEKFYELDGLDHPDQSIPDPSTSWPYMMYAVYVFGSAMVFFSVVAISYLGYYLVKNWSFFGYSRIGSTVQTEHYPPNEYELAVISPNRAND